MNLEQNRNRTPEESQNIRDLQLQNHRAEQQKMADYLKPAQAVVTKIPNKAYVDNLNRLLPEIISLNISSLNTIRNAKILIDNELDYRINELYNLMKNIVEECGSPIPEVSFPKVEPHTTIGLNNRLKEVRVILNKLTSKSIGLLNIGNGNISSSSDREIPSEIYELYYIIKDLKENFRHSAKLIA